MGERNIQVTLTPHTWDNAENPYFWVVMEWDEKGEFWFNSGLCGWAKTPTDAFNEAYQCQLQDINKT